MTTSKPHADIRPWLAEHHRGVPAATRLRINESYDHIDHILDGFGEHGCSRALDVGCGSGLDTFALAAHFEWTTAIDASLRRILLGRFLAWRTGVRSIRFVHAVAEAFASPERFDFVYCNIMSDLVSSRRRLAANIASLAADRSILYYAEATEGYAAMELARAVEKQNAAELRVRLHQLVNGFCGLPMFRFYVAGSAAAVFAAHGFTVIAQQQKSWTNLIYEDSLWLRRKSGSAVESAGADADYVELDPDFAVMREQFQAALSGRAPAMPDKELNRFAPYLVLLRLAKEVVGTDLGQSRSLAERLRTHAGSVSAPDWARVTALMDEFKERIAA